jgi:hypothetical protein
MNSLPHESVPFRWHDHLSALRRLGLLYRRPQQFRDDLLTYSVGQQVITAVWLPIHSAPYIFVLCAACYLLRTTLGGSEFNIWYLAIWIPGIAIAIAIGGIIFRILTKSIIGSLIGIGFGIGTGINFGLGDGIPDSSPLCLARITLAISWGISFGIVYGIVYGIAFGIGVGIRLGIFYGIGFGIVSGIAGLINGWIIGGISAGIAGGISSWIVGGIFTVIFMTRIYYQLIHPLFVWPRLHGRWYPRHPVAWDDLCGVPFPCLDRLLVDYAEKVPESGLPEIERLISSYPSQRMMALRARVRLLARQAGKTANLGILDEMVSALPKGEKGFLAQTGQLCAAVQELATLQRQLDAIDRPVLREPLAQLLCQRIENFRDWIGSLEEPIATEFRTAADQWLKIAEKQLREAQAGEGKEPVL